MAWELSFGMGAKWKRRLIEEAKDLTAITWNYSIFVHWILQYWVLYIISLNFISYPMLWFFFFSETGSINVIQLDINPHNIFWLEKVQTLVCQLLQCSIHLILGLNSSHICIQEVWQNIDYVKQNFVYTLDSQDYIIISK